MQYVAYGNFKCCNWWFRQLVPLSIFVDDVVNALQNTICTKSNTFNNNQIIFTI